MVVKPVRTDKITPGSGAIFGVLDNHLGRLRERTVVAITSKIVAICEGRVVPIAEADKNELAIEESQYYLPEHMSRYGYSFTITHNTLIPVAGIDESNGDGNYVLWPADPQKSANQIRAYLSQKARLKKIGVVITDSTAKPLHLGTEGVGIAFSGFKPMNNYVGQKDLFGREFKVSSANVVDGLASAAVMVMGEGTEQTPIALIEDVDFIEFTGKDPSESDLKELFVSHMEDDLFEPFLRQMGWRKGGRAKDT